MAERRTLFSQIDFLLLIPVLVMMTVGIMFIYSSGVTSQGASVSFEWLRQIIWVVLGLTIMVLLSFIRYDLYREIAIFAYIGFLVLVVIASVVGRTVNGSKNWLGIGELGIQPSEFLKVATIVMLAVSVDSWGEKIKELRYFFYAGLIVLIPVGVILFQQDLGTAMVFVPIFLFVMVAAGAKARHILYVLLTIGLTIFLTILVSWDQYLLKVKVPFLSIFTNKTLFLIVAGSLVLLTALSFLGWRVFKRRYFYYLSYVFSIITIAVLAQYAARLMLKPYQVTRLIVFLDPNYDAKGSGWNIIQSINAVGSGGVWGKGFLQGVQSHLRYLPEQSTDFIFSILSEEWGFAGGLAIFACYAALVYRGLAVSSKARDPMGSMIAAGIIGMFFFHMLVNIGMAIGIMPVVGIPLLFVSYGGSSSWTAFAALGILMSVNAYRYQF